MKQRKRLLAVALSFAMMLNTAVPVFAETTAGEYLGERVICTHHTNHGDECGYKEGHPCGHRHVEGCYTQILSCDLEAIDPVASDSNSLHSHNEECYESELDCSHKHDRDCGYEPLELCTFDPAACGDCKEEAKAKKMLLLSEATEWDGKSELNGGEWNISAGNDVVITDDVAINNGAKLAIDPEASLTVRGGTFSINGAEITGTVIVEGDGVIDGNKCDGGILDVYNNNSLDSVIIRGGTMWFADGTIDSITVESGLADLYRNARVEEAVNSGGTLWSSQGAQLKKLTTSDTGASQCGNGGRIEEAWLLGSSAGLYCWYSTDTGNGGSVGSVNVSGYTLLTVEKGCTIDKVMLECGTYQGAEYPLVKNMGTITNFEGTGGYVLNEGEMTNVKMYEDPDTVGSGVDFRNNAWDSEKPGTVKQLILEYGLFFNENDSILEKAVLYDTYLSHDSSVPIQEVRMLESKVERPDEIIPDGGELTIWGPAQIETVRLHSGRITMYDDAYIGTLVREDGCKGILEKDPDSVIENELENMAAVSWEEPLDGDITITYNGIPLSSGTLISVGEEVEVLAEPEDADTYKLLAGSLKANGTAIAPGTYTVTGDTEFEAQFILSTDAQPWDGTTDILVADTYEITKPVVISERRTIVKDAQVYISGSGSLTVNGVGELVNNGTIEGTVKVTGSKARSVSARLNNTATGIIDTAIAEGGGTLSNEGLLKTLVVTKNGLAYSSGSAAKIEKAAVETGSLTNSGKSVIVSLTIDTGSVENIGADIQSAELLGGHLKNTSNGSQPGTIGLVTASGGRLENGEGCVIEKLSLTDDHSLVLENKGEVTETEGTIVTGYELTDDKMTLTKNEYFNKTGSVTIIWNPVKSVGSTATAPVSYTLKVYDKPGLTGTPVASAQYASNRTEGGASGLKFDTTYYVTLEAKVVSGNVEKDKIFSYQTLEIHTLQAPEELGAINVDKVTLKPGESYQFIALNTQGKPIANIPIEWSVQGSGEQRLTSKNTKISERGLLTVGADEQAQKLLVGCHRSDGYLTNYSADVLISQVIPEKYQIEVQSTKGGMASASVYSAEEDTFVLLFAEPEKGYQLKEWQCSAGEIVPYGIDDAYTALRMPAQNVTVTAHFEKISTGGSDDSDNSGNFMTTIPNTPGNWVVGTHGWQFQMPDGTMIKNSWVRSSNYWYFINQDGLMMTKWILWNDNWYYLNPEKGASEGSMRTGWVYDEEYQKWFYLDGEGRMMWGSHKIDGKWYYFNPGPDGIKGAMEDTSVSSD